MKIGFSPTVRMTFGVVCVTVSLILAADMFGLIPSNERLVTQQRQRFVETLSMQLSLIAEKSTTAAVKELLLGASNRNNEVVSAALIRKDGVSIAEYGDHKKTWLSKFDLNSSTQMKLPVFRGKSAFATLEVSFVAVPGPGFFGIPISVIGALVVFVIGVGSFIYWYLIRRSLVYLDPNAVVPDRVRAALDVLANGVLVLDDEEHIVLANRVFSEKVNKPLTALIGTLPSALPWRQAPEHGGIFPWTEALNNGVARTSVTLQLETENNNRRTFVVNCSPIYGDDKKSKPRGVMVGFDDITELEHKNALLHDMLAELESAKHHVEKQNKELHFLATRDSLTGCYNRRSFNQKFGDIFRQATLQQEKLSCVMCDIDHFKLVNDTYGHAAGDEVIVMVAKVLQESIPEGADVARYGGEEFCVMLPGVNVFDAKKIAELLRRRISEGVCGNNIRITGSFGVAGLSQGAANMSELIKHADEALYESKKTGRNRVSGWQRRIQSGGGEPKYNAN
jgi:diguanylate cyclase (GGDEF)-like protein